MNWDKKTTEQLLHIAGSYRYHGKPIPLDLLVELDSRGISVGDFN